MKTFMNKLLFSFVVLFGSLFVFTMMLISVIEESIKERICNPERLYPVTKEEYKNRRDK